jgi:hypothetical protein
MPGERELEAKQTKLKKAMKAPIDIEKLRNKGL